MSNQNVVDTGCRFKDRRIYLEATGHGTQSGSDAALDFARSFKEAGEALITTRKMRRDAGRVAT